jgi:hypothetical protein
MSIFSDIASRASQVQLRTYGEPVTLAGGSVKTGIFTLGADMSLLEDRSNRISSLAIEQQASPKLRMLETDAIGISERDEIIVRGVDYIVIRLTTDGDLWTTIELGQVSDSPLTDNGWQ